MRGPDKHVRVDTVVTSNVYTPWTRTEFNKALVSQKNSVADSSFRRNSFISLLLFRLKPGWKAC